MVLYGETLDFITSAMVETLAEIDGGSTLCARKISKNSKTGEGAAVPPHLGPYTYAVSIWSPSGRTGTSETTIWKPGFIRKMETARDDYLQTRLNAGFIMQGWGTKDLNLPHWRKS